MLKALRTILTQAMKEWFDDNAPRVGAALAFYAIFAIAPLFVICIAVAGLIFGEDAARGQLLNQAKGIVGEEGGKALQAMVVSAAEPKSGLIATSIGLVMMILGAIGLFSELKAALNIIWNVKPRPDLTWRDFIKERLLSFAMVIIMAIILLAMLVASATLSAMTSYFNDSPFAYFGPLGNTLLTFTVITLVFAMIYRYLPDAKIAWSDVWLGAVITAVLFSAGNYAIAIYLGRSALSSAYGAAGSLAALLLWLYYAAQVFLAGAEITQVYAKWHGSGINPSEHAELAHTDKKPSD